MKTAFISLTIAMLVGIAFYAWTNRGSDRIVLTFFTAMFAGAVGFTAKEAVSNKIESRTEELSVAVLFSHDAYRPLPLRLPYHSELSIFIQALPETIRASEQDIVDISHGQDVYFPAVAYALLSKSMSPFTHGWDSEVVQFSSPGGISTESRGGTRTGEQVSLRQLFDVLGFDLQFEDDQQAFRSDSFHSYYLPPKTKYRLVESNEFTRQIAFENRFLTLTISVRKAHSSIGIGEYSEIFEVSESTAGNAAFRVVAELTQNRLLNGHPDMEAHRKWADTIIDGIDRDFNYEKIRSDLVEEFQFRGPKALRVY